MSKHMMLAGVALSATAALAGTTVPAKARGIQSVYADGTPGNLTQILATLQKDFADFKDANDRKLNAKADVVLDEKVARIDASVAALQAAADQANAQLAAMALNGSGARDIRDPEYTDAFRAHFRKGETQASLNKGNAPEGGYLPLLEWDRTITNWLVQVSPMREIASVQTIGGVGFRKLFNSRGMGSG